MALHKEIGEIESKVHRTDPNLRLHAYVPSITPATRIDDGQRSATEWKQEGVYFLNEPDCLKQVIRHALEPASAN